MLRLIRRIASTHDCREAADALLLRRFAADRDEAAFAELLRRHGPMVMGVCRRVLRHEVDAEDAFQAAFLVLARKAASIARPELLAGWLYGVACRTARRAQADRARHRNAELRDVPAPVPTAEAEWSDLGRVLDDEVYRLPDKYRTPFLLCHVAGKTNDEAARLLGVPKGTVLSRLSRARERLRRRLTRRGITLSAAVFPTIVSRATASAGVSPTFAAFVAQSAVAFANVNATHITSAHVFALTEGVLSTMWMKRFTFVTALLLSVCAVGSVTFLVSRTGQAAPPVPAEGAAPKPEPAKADLLETLTALEKQSWEALKRQDAAALEKLVTPDCAAILSDGSRTTAAELIKGLKDFRVQEYAMDDAKLVPLSPDAAVLVYRVKSEIATLGERKRETLQVSSTWVKKDGKWLNAFYQETPIAQNGPKTAAPRR
jgi:RNA polymerase sigma factor (sigma-70 family)